MVHVKYEAHQHRCNRYKFRRIRASKCSKVVACLLCCGWRRGGLDLAARLTHIWHIQYLSIVSSSEHSRVKVIDLRNSDSGSIDMTRITCEVCVKVVETTYALQGKKKAGYFVDPPQTWSFRLRYIVRCCVPHWCVYICINDDTCVHRCYTRKYMHICTCIQLPTFNISVHMYMYRWFRLVLVGFELAAMICM